MKLKFSFVLLPGLAMLNLAPVLAQDTMQDSKQESKQETKVITQDYGKKFLKPFMQRKRGTTVKDDYGGYISRYIAMYKLEAGKGTSYILDGACASACTTILGIIPKARVCTTSKGTLGFHSGYIWWFGKWHSPYDTKLMWSFYPEEVRAVLIKNFGWDGGKGQKHLEMMWIDAGSFYDACDAPMLQKLKELKA